jgi:hypothetical protein
LERDSSSVYWLSENYLPLHGNWIFYRPVP